MLGELLRQQSEVVGGERISEAILHLEGSLTRLDALRAAAPSSDSSAEVASSPSPRCRPRFATMARLIPGRKRAPPAAVAGAIAMMIAAGILAGIFPALKAMRLSIIDALARA